MSLIMKVPIRISIIKYLFKELKKTFFDFSRIIHIIEFYLQIQVILTLRRVEWK